MLINYLKTALRNIARHKVFSLINVIGLAIGMACTIFVLLWVQDELSYEKYFNNADNIYLVLRGNKLGMSAVTSQRLTPALKQELPEIKEATSFMQLPESFEFLIKNNKVGFNENLIVADSNFFKVFSYEFIEGDALSALSEPNSIVLTKDMANKYFGKENALGKTLVVSGFGGEAEVNVSGVVRNIPSQSYLKRQIFLQAGWFKTIGIDFNRWEDQSFQTFIRVKENSATKELAYKIKECEVKNNPNHSSKNLSYSLLPFTKIHLYGNNIKFLTTTGDIKYVSIFIAIAVIILLIASINYMNLSTALSLKRSKEVGIKKTLGAERKNLIIQFFGESFVTTFIAYGLAILFVELFLPEFNSLTGKKLEILHHSFLYIIFSIIIVVITGLISGSYPAIFLSSFSPIKILKGKLKLGLGNLVARKGLVVFQFVVSITIITCTFIVFYQLSFIRNSNIGFDKENLLCVKMTADANSRFKILKNEISKYAGVLNISRSEPVSGSLTHTGEVSWKGKLENESVQFCVLHTDCNLADVYKFKVKTGRYFSGEYPSDSTNAYVINETAQKLLGLISPLGSEINLWGKTGRVIGVVKDFHLKSFHTAIEPLIIQMPDKRQLAGRFRVMTIRYKSSDPGELISHVENTWNEQFSGEPFEYYFYDDSLNQRYFTEIRMGTIFEYFSILSIVIACLGLFGLSSYASEQRTKEIGVRKVLGASVLSVTTILSKEFLLLVIASNLIAFPVAWYLMNGWLQDFAYRIDISWWVFVLSGGIALLIALATVSYQAIKAATANPIESLKYE